MGEFAINSLKQKIKAIYPFRSIDLFARKGVYIARWAYSLKTDIK